MQQIDRRLGLILALLAAAVLWSARNFPNVPGQKVGAGFLPMLVGAGLLLCGIALVIRSFGARRGLATDAATDAAADAAPVDEHIRAPLIVVGAVLLYILLADRIGFLLIAPVCLVLVFRILLVNWQASILWAASGTLVVHFAFYKLLRVPLPWGVLRPFY